jgi:hypothetical protein
MKNIMDFMPVVFLGIFFTFLLSLPNSSALGQSFEELGEVTVEVDNDDDYQFSADIIRFIDDRPNAFINTADDNDEVEVDNGDEVEVEIPLLTSALRNVFVFLHNGNTLDISGENYTVSTLETSLKKDLFNGELGTNNRVTFDFPEDLEDGNYQMIVRIQPTNQSEAYYVTDLEVD